MDAIYLPLLGMSSSIDSAVDALRVGKVSGLVGATDQKLWLYDARAILRARRGGAKSLAELATGASIHRITLSDLDGFEQRALVFPQRYPGSYQQIFDRYQHHDFAAFGAVDQLVLVLTRSESLKAMLFEPDTYCTGPAQHSLPPAGRNSAGKCDICGYAFESL